MINNMNDGSGERLFLVRKALGMKQIDFAKILNSSNGHVSDMEKDRKNITDSTIELLSLKCNVSEEYIRYGKGDMFLNTPSTTMTQLKKEFNLNDFDYSFVYEYLKLSPEKKTTVREFFQSVIKSDEKLANQIETEVTQYRRELELEARQGEKLSALDITKERKKA